jgi:hypothetical protein
MGKPGRTAPRDFGLELQICAPVAQHDIPAPPRTLSIGDPGWRRFAGRLTVTLDREDVTRRCVGFDCDKGTITRQRLDEAGRIFVDPDTDGVAIETLTGAVRVAWK